MWIGAGEIILLPQEKLPDSETFILKKKKKKQQRGHRVQRELNKAMHKQKFLRMHDTLKLLPFIIQAGFIEFSIIPNSQQLNFLISYFIKL